ncbi:MAG: response regulator transcription factor [Gomphosphaeria aponina SAG 52.96 = DSM 107014]|uniref:Response regulator transcription factor n=1 Tax=Gomphosphaeria aponina SAG 52.96 = DSM 107014 TaxID=1521640 RepID=A0A941GTL7_9CHRO|nr:response regulator transcription factor [Gomphosphaeria aponina SAG 52.96 = DSM 107014]
MKILLVEDERHIAKALAEALKDKNYTVEIATDGEEAWELMQAFSYDLIVLDLMLPKLDGISLCKRLRSAGDNRLILMLTAKDTSLDQVMGLDVGADDYVVKPFELQALLARIRALLRRRNTTLSPILTWELLTLDPSKCEVKYNGVLLHLTPKEYALLELLLRSGDRILTRSAILDNIWAFEDTPGAETVKVHLRGLRMKLKAAQAPLNLIETVYGLGYRLNPNI